MAAREKKCLVSPFLTKDVKDQGDIVNDHFTLQWQIVVGRWLSGTSIDLLILLNLNQQTRKGKMDSKLPVLVLLTSVFLFLFAFGGRAQCITGTANQAISGCPGNLVPNPSFEAVDTCACFDGNTGDFWFNDATYLTDWTEPTQGSSDFYHTCNAGPSNDGVPVNNFGVQNPRTGNGYAHFMTYGTGSPPYREYLQTQLTTPMVAGRVYEVSFYVSKPDQSRWASNNIGAHLSTFPVSTNTFNVLNVTAHVLETNVITDAVSWTRISGSYTAAGGEQYLTIGNFFNDGATSRTDLGLFFLNAGYYIDDVCVNDVTPLDITNQGPDFDLPGLPGSLSVDLSGNPIHSASKLWISSPKQQELWLDLIGMDGRVLKSDRMLVEAGTFSHNWFSEIQLAQGTYLLQVRDRTGQFRDHLRVVAID